MLHTLKRTQRSCRDWQKGGFSSCAMEHSKDQWRLSEATCRKTFWFCLSLVCSHRPEAVMGLDRRCVSAAAFQVVFQHKLQGWRDGHAVTTPGDALWNPTWAMLERQSLAGMQQCSKGLSLRLHHCQTHCSAHPETPTKDQEPWRAQDLHELQPVLFDYQQMEDACKREIIN